MSTATQGAMAVVDGNDPSEEPRQQMFIWNNIFCSLGFDVKAQYRDLGGGAATDRLPWLPRHCPNYRAGQ